MARFFRNRKAIEWKALAKAFGLEIVNNNRDGDDEVWGRKNKSGIVILIPSRDNEVVILPTAMTMARKFQLLLSISKKDILKWWVDNGFGE